jgi:hypothetical protein
VEQARGAGDVSHPDLDKLLEQLGHGGWGDLEDIEKRAAGDAKASREKALQMARTVEACFSTRAGKEVLEWLCQATIYRRGAWQGQSFEALDKITGYGLFREGQNSLVWMILDAMAAARGEQPSGGE